MHITLEDVSKQYGSRTALARTSMVFGESRTTVLIGPSGCGKSTLLRLVIGLISPDTGSVVVNGEPIRAPQFIALRRRTGYVIQEGGLFPHLSARDNLALAPREVGWDRERIETRIETLLPLVRLEGEHLDRYPIEMSGGQRQRVGLMRALMLSPELLLLDEPLGALDPMVRYELQRDLKSIFATLGTTVIMVTHDLAEAAYLADDIVLMRDGHILQRGLLADMIASPADPFVTDFITAQRQLHEVDA
ncbi:MAG: ATP-binding cassette domain-containing protein [bacterium]|nr:ATP-binding cassette domain-containing protein [Candidatus Kapabacteria bacterium]